MEKKQHVQFILKKWYQYTHPVNKISKLIQK